MKYIVLLRGVNVGGRTIKMAELKGCFEKNDYQNVQTVLQSGNVILDTSGNDAKVKAKIEKLLQECIKYPALVYVISPADLAKKIEAYPFTGVDKDFHRYLVFTDKGSEKQMTEDCGKLDSRMEEVAPGDGVVYWRVQKGATLDSDFGKWIARFSTKNFTTTRNMNTLEKILAKCK